MPIYEYDCPKCGVVEVMQRITEDPLKKCPNCKCKVKRLISLNNFHLKGTGWYATDYAGKNAGSGANGGNGKNGKSHESGAESSASKETSAKSDTSKSDGKIAASAGTSS